MRWRTEGGGKGANGERRMRIDGRNKGRHSARTHTQHNMCMRESSTAHHNSRKNERPKGKEQRQRFLHLSPSSHSPLFSPLKKRAAWKVACRPVFDDQPTPSHVPRAPSSFHEAGDDRFPPALDTDLFLGFSLSNTALSARLLSALLRRLSFSLLCLLRWSTTRILRWR